MINSAIVTGANGFIGTYLVEELLNRNIKVYAIARNDFSRKLQVDEQKKENLKLVLFDYKEISLLEDYIPKDCDVCIHLAWDGITGIGRSDYKIQLDNIDRSIQVMQVLSGLGCKRFLGASSIRELEANMLMPHDNVVPGERFIYPIAKQTVHYMNKCLSNTWGIDYINVFIANTYGEYGSDDLILHDTIIRLLKGIKMIYTSATEIYDFVYVKDVVNGLIAIAEKGHKNCSYYIGSGEERELKEYLEIIKEIIHPEANLGLGMKVSDGISLPKEMFDISKLVHHTGFVPKYKYEESVRAVILWYENSRLCKHN